MAKCTLAISQAVSGSERDGPKVCGGVPGTAECAGADGNDEGVSLPFGDWRSEKLAAITYRAKK